MEATFKVGVTYYVRATGDWDCVYTFKVVRRTRKTVWLERPSNRADYRCYRQNQTQRDGWDSDLANIGRRIHHGSVRGGPEMRPFPKTTASSQIV